MLFHTVTKEEEPHIFRKVTMVSFSMFMWVNRVSWSCFLLKHSAANLTKKKCILGQLRKNRSANKKVTVMTVPVSGSVTSRLPLTQLNVSGYTASLRARVCTGNAPRSGFEKVNGESFRRQC